MNSRALHWPIQLSLSLILLCGAGFCTTGLAQVPEQQLPAQTNPGLLTTPADEQWHGPAPRATKTPDPDSAIPGAPKTPAPVVDLPDNGFYVKSIQVEGNTAVSKAEIQPLLQTYENKTVTLDDLGKLVSAINKLYYEKGYYMSQAYIPAQDVDQQSIVIKVQEGRIGKISVEGNRFLQAQIVQRDVDAQAGDVLNARELEETLRRLSTRNNSPYKVRAVLSSGQEPGQTDVRLRVRERMPWQVSPTFDNQGRPFIGMYRWGVELESVDLTGVEDHFRARWIQAADTQVATASYFLPLNRYGTQLGTTFAFSRVTPDVDRREVTGRAFDYAAVVVQPLDRERRFTLDASLNFRRIRTDVKDDPRLDSRDNISALRFGLNYDNTDRWGRSILRAETSVAPGWLGANREFWKSDLYATRLIPLPARNMLILRGNAQFTPDGLPPAEMMQIGGVYSVRGYTEGVLVGDRGYNFSIEHRWPIPGLGRVSPYLASRVMGATFFDLGQVWEDPSNRLFVAGFSNNRKHTLLAGTGVGLRIRLSSLMQGYVDFGWGLLDRSGVDRNLIEPNGQPSFRVHFGIRANLLPEDYRDWTASSKVSQAPRTLSPAMQPSDHPPLTTAELRP